MDVMVLGIVGFASILGKVTLVLRSFRPQIPFPSDTNSPRRPWTTSPKLSHIPLAEATLSSLPFPSPDPKPSGFHPRLRGLLYWNRSAEERRPGVKGGSVPTGAYTFRCFDHCRSTTHWDPLALRLGSQGRPLPPPLRSLPRRFVLPRPHCDPRGSPTPGPGPREVS